MEPNRTGRGGFTQLLRTEWIKFQTVRGWVIGIVVAALITVLPGLLIATGSACQGPNGDVCPAVPVGPNGEAATDKFFFVHQPLAGDGSMTVRVTSLTGLITYPPPNHDQIVAGVVPWAKAGVIIKESTKQGSAYAAMMLTGSHGVWMQHNFTAGTAGQPGGVSAESPRWLRLTRSGDTLTGDESTDGIQWTSVGTAHLAGLPATVPVGFFVTSPCDLTVSEGACRFTNATAVFDHVSLQGKAPRGAWSSDDLGVESGLPDHLYGGVEKSGGTFTVTGSGDIAPLGAEGGWPIERTLLGTLAGMIAVIIVAVLFVTAEYRPGWIRTTQLAGPRRDRVLVAKAIVIGTVTFVAGLAATIVAVALGRQIQRNYILPVPPITELRVMFGTAALLAVAAILALALGALFRRSVAAMTAGIALVVLPYILAVANILPLGASQWLLRLTPAAGFAIQQSIPQYPQVIGLYTPQAGYYPLAPWAGFAVLCGYTALALGLAVFLPRRRDA
ncbi:MAG: ABC transporter permease subunit [Roseiflexaceae bacterium]